MEATTKQYLDYNGLKTIFNLLNDKFATKEEVAELKEEITTIKTELLNCIEAVNKLQSSTDVLVNVSE